MSDHSHHFEKTVVIDGNSLTFDESIEVAFGRAKVVIAEGVKEKVEANRESIITLAKGDKPIYGFTRGFGQNQDVAVPEEGLINLQKNLIRTHAISFGDPSPKEVVRMAVLYRANALAKGFSGIRFELVQALVDFVNEMDVYAFVPEVGSLGASGDLSPLSHISLAVMGEGKCYYKDELIDASEALKKVGLTPIELQAKEGLGLNNGMQWTTAYIAWHLYKLQKRTFTGLVFAGFMSEIMLAADLPYQKELHELRPYAGQIKVAEILTKLFQESGIRQSHEDFGYDVNVQDPYSSRCLPQIYGPMFDAMEETKAKIEIEMNSATDNPLVVGSKSISGGNFHGMYLALATANLFNAFCATVTANMSLVRRIVDKDKNRLGISCLISPEAENAISSGMMICEYSHTAHGNLILSKNSAAFLHAQSSASHQEDHVSHAPTVVLNMKEAMELHETQLALQMAIIKQGYYVLEKSEENWKKEGKIGPNATMNPGRCGTKFLSIVDDTVFAPLAEDRYMQEDVEKLRTEYIVNDRLHDELTACSCECE